MGRVKDLYIAEFERQYNEKLEAGMDPDTAYKTAGEAAYTGVRDALEEAADVARQRKKDDAMCERIDKNKK